MFHRLFRAHPVSVGETYAQHMGVAMRFGATMIAGGIACLVHGLVPALFVRTGSGTIKRLHDRMAARQPGAGGHEVAQPAWNDPRWRPEYEI